MARKRNGGPSLPMPGGPAERPTAPLVPPENPIGHAPYGDPAFNPARIDQALMQGFGPPSAGLLQVEQAVIKGIGEGLGAVGSSLARLDSRIRTGMSSELTAPIPWGGFAKARFFWL